MQSRIVGETPYNNKVTCERVIVEYANGVKPRDRIGGLFFHDSELSSKTFDDLRPNRLALELSAVKGARETGELGGL